MKTSRGSFGTVCLLAWMVVLVGLWLWHRADRSLPTYVREPFEGGVAEARVPSQGGRYGFLLTWSKRVAELEDPVHVEVSAEAMERGTVSVGAAGTTPTVSSWAALEGRAERPELDALVPGHAFGPWTYLGAKDLPPGEVLVRLTAPNVVAFADAAAASRAASPATESRPTGPSHLWVVPLSQPDPVSFTSDPQAMIVCAAVATLLVLIAYGVGRRGPPAAGKILFAMWLVVVAAAGASWFLSESRKAPIRVPLKDGVGAAEFDCRNVRMRFFLSFDDRPAGPEGPRHVALPASAWARGGLVHSSRLIAGPLYDWRPCLASGRWDLLNFLWHVHGPMNESPESGYEPFVAASSRAYLGERRFLDGRNFVRFSMPTAPLPEGMPTQSPTSLWLVPDRPDRLMEDLWKLFLAAVVGGSGLLLLLAGWGMRAARARPRSQAIMTRGDPDSFELDRFYLSSTEDVRFGSGPPFVCSPVARLRLGDNDQILVIRISPPLQTGYSRPSCATIETLAITPHVEGDTLFPVSKWPLSVHVYADLPPLKRGRTFSLKRGTMLAWCDIYRDLPSAEARSV